MKKRILATLLTLCMVLTLLPTIASAEESGLPQLADPTGLTWDADSLIRWETNGAFQNKCDIHIYKVGVEERVYKTTVTYGAHFQENTFNGDYFILWCDDFESGDYYFTVQNLGDGTQYTDSNIVSSQDLENGIFHYTKPDAKLTAVEKGTWDWPAAVWDDKAENNTKLRYYSIEYGFSKTAEGKIEDIGGSNGWTSGQEDLWLQDKLIGENGNGYYYFKVRPISKDILQWQNGDFSPWSDGYNLQAASEGIKGELDKLRGSTTEDIKKGVQALNHTELMNAMRADLENKQNGTINALAALEEEVEEPVDVNVNEGVKSLFSKEDISVVGAALNNKTDSSKVMALNIGRAEPKDIRDENYNNTVAVNFSMELENANQLSGKLAVPVKITLPIPSNINPEFLAVLHYHQDGSHEELFINTYQENGKWYVSFVLDSFSDFVMTELKGGTPAAPTAVTGVSLDKNTASVQAGRTVTLIPTVSPANATNKSVTWSSSNTNIATVANGVVTGVKEGTAAITVTTADGSFTASCVVTVTSSNTGNTGSSGGSSSSDSSSDSDPSYTVSAPSSVTGGTVKVTPTGADKGDKVTITVTPSSGYELDKLTVTDAKGNQVALTDAGNNKYTFVMPASQVSVDTSFKRASTNSSADASFVDVAPNAYYAAPVAWAVANGITAGTSAATFGPDAPCTRGQIMTFLWRAAGSPVVGGSSSFTDVDSGAYYAQAVQWAVAQGITSGTSAATFSPDAACTRAQAMAFLYKAKGSPAVTGSGQFADVDSGVYYAQAVQWAVANGVTSGTGASTFGPDSRCTRAQIVTFLYHAFA